MTRTTPYSGGTASDHGDTDARPVLEAAEVRARILERASSPEAFALTGKRIVGRLDLGRCAIDRAVHFSDCSFADRIDLTDARVTQIVEFDCCELTGLFMDRLECSADLILRDSVSYGALSLHWASIGGDIRCTGSRLLMPNGVALNARDLRLSGSLFLDGPDFLARGEVCLLSADIEGSIDFRHARFENRGGRCIDASELALKGEFLCEDGFSTLGEFRLTRAVARRLRVSGGRLDKGETDHALRGDDLRVESSIEFTPDFHARGTVNLVGADIGGQVRCSDAEFANPAGIALDARRIRAVDVYLDRGFRAAGDVRLDGANIMRQLNCTQGQFTAGVQYALDGDGMHVLGEIFLNDGFHSTGEVRFIGAHVQNELNCTGGRLHNPGGTALDASRLVTPGNIYLNSDGEHEFQAQGVVRLLRAKVTGEVTATGAVMRNADAGALDLTGADIGGDLELDRLDLHSPLLLRGAHVGRDLVATAANLAGEVDARSLTVRGSLFWQLGRPPGGMVDLSFGFIQRLNDNLGSWYKGRYRLTGLTYETLADSGPLTRQRINWLEETDGYSADAYHQLADCYRRSGDESSAREVSIARQRDLRRRGKLNRGQRLWNYILDRSTCYGYQLHRPLWILLIFAILGTVIFTAAHDSGYMIFSSPALPHVPAFYPVAYTLQLLLPVFDVQQTPHWFPDPSRPYASWLTAYIWLSIIVGWICGVALAAGLARLIRQR